MPEFEWEEDKAAANWRDHGVAFQEAIQAFRDTFAVERIDDREDYGAHQSDRHVRGRAHPRDLHRAQRTHSDHLC